MTSAEILDREFLGVRARLIEVAAVLDRIDRSQGATETTGSDRIAKIREAIEVLGTCSTDDRASLIQMIFSLPADGS